MLNKKFIYMFLLVLLLSMGTVTLAQEATPPPAPSGRVALTLEERVEGLELSALQVGNTCVPPVFGRYILNAKVPQAPWAAMITYVPRNPADKLPLGNFNPEIWAFNSFSEKRGLKAGLSQEFEINKISERIMYIMVPDFWGWSQEQSATCAPATDMWEIPILLVGEPETGILQGVGSAVKSTNVGAGGGIWFEVASFNPTDVLVFQERTLVGVDGKLRAYTYQRTFETSGKGVFNFEIAPGWLMKNTPVKIHLRDRVSNVTTTTYLLGGDRAYLGSGGSVYNLDIPRYCLAFTGNKDCSLSTETELRSRSAEEPKNLDWFWELTGQATRRR